MTESKEALLYYIHRVTREWEKNTFPPLLLILQVLLSQRKKVVRLKSANTNKRVLHETRLVQKRHLRKSEQNTSTPTNLHKCQKTKISTNLLRCHVGGKNLRNLTILSTGIK